MNWLRSGICLSALLIGLGTAEAGSCKNCRSTRVVGCAAPVATCAAPVSCAVPHYAPVTCAVPAPSCGCAGGGAVGYGAGFNSYSQGFDGGYLAGGPGPITFPTRGITPQVIPGNELTW